MGRFILRLGLFLHYVDPQLGLRRLLGVHFEVLDELNLICTALLLN